MHIRHALALAAGGLLLTAVAPVPAAHADDQPTDRLTINPVGKVSEDGTITLFGWYRCVNSGTPGPVFVGANIISDDLGSGVGGVHAVCDGRTHRWHSQAQPAVGPVGPGHVTVEGTMMKLRNDERGIPTPHFLAVRDQEVDLRPDGH